MYLERDRLLWSPRFNEDGQKPKKQCIKKGSRMVSETKLALKEGTRIVLAMQNVPEER